MKIYIKIIALLCLPFIFCFETCTKKSGLKNENTKKKEKKYLFPYQTIVRKLPRDCADSRTDNSIYWLNISQEKLLLGIKISLQDEAEVGLEVHNYIKQNMTFVEGDPLSRVSLIFNKMRPFLSRKDVPFEVFVIDIPTENAFACPGGRMYITLPLINAMNDDQLACIIGHELCHIEQKHCNVHLKYRKLIGKPLSNILDILTQGLGQRDELEADLGGLYLAYKAGYDPSVSTDAFRRWGVQEKPSFGNKIFRSHPYCNERINCINAYLKQAKKNGEGLNRIF